MALCSIQKAKILPAGANRTAKEPQNMRKSRKGIRDTRRLSHDLDNANGRKAMRSLLAHILAVQTHAGNAASPRPWKIPCLRKLRPVPSFA